MSREFRKSSCEEICNEFYKNLNTQSTQIQTHVPMKSRNLPASLFIEPRKSHPPVHPPEVVHSRAHSLPVHYEYNSNFAPPDYPPVIRSRFRTRPWGEDYSGLPEEFEDVWGHHNLDDMNDFLQNV